MTYLKKTTTLVLFLMLVVSIGVFTYSVFFYQRTLASLNDVVSGKEDRIAQLAGEISSLRGNLSGLSQQFDLQLEREANLSGQYTDLKSAKEQIDSEKKGLTKELNQTQKDLAAAESLISDLQKDLGDKKDTILELNQSLSDIRDDTEYICKKASSLNITRCEDY